MKYVINIRLNPCCNGIYSMSYYGKETSYWAVSLNPCCNGIYSMSAIIYTIGSIYGVLILVVMEYTQWDISMNNRKTLVAVLILVVMEYTQWVVHL